MSQMLIINLVLTSFWLIMSADFSLGNGIFGFALGGLILFLIRDHLGRTKYLHRLWLILRLFFYFIYELLLSGFRVVSIVLMAPQRHQTAIIAYPLSLRGNFKIVLLANMITLTPGTLSVDIDSVNRLLYIHVLDVADAELLKREIRAGFERMIKEAFD